MSNLDLGNLTPVAATMPNLGGRKRSKSIDTCITWLRDSWESNEGKAVTVSRAQVPALSRLLRSAATECELGLKLSYSDKNGTAFPQNDLNLFPSDAPITVTFQAVERRDYTRK